MKRWVLLALLLFALDVAPVRANGFGVVRRPDGRLQVTYNGLAVYTYVHEGPNQVLCNNVDGWFVVRL